MQEGTVMSTAMDFMELLCNDYGLRFEDYEKNDRKKIKDWVWNTATKLNDEWWHNFATVSAETGEEMDPNYYHEEMAEMFEKEIQKTWHGTARLGDMAYDLSRIADHYGWQHQLLQAIEEMAELTQAISKFERANEAMDSKEAYNLKEEVADVTIMMEQIKLFFNCDKEVRQIMREKIDRQLARIKKEKEEK